MKIATLNDALKKLDDYKKNYRKADLAPLEISGIYSLFPDFEDDKNIKSDHRWPDTWPFLNRQGIYIILGNNLKVLYVGKVSMSNTFGGRFISYFSYDVDKKSCKVNHTWTEEPRYLVIVAVPEGMSFEAPALEEYMIRELKDCLPDNKIGK